MSSDPTALVRNACINPETKLRNSVKILSETGRRVLLSTVKQVRISCNGQVCFFGLM